MPTSLLRYCATVTVSLNSQWAEINNLRLNPLKIWELIVFKSSNRWVPTNRVICGAERVQSLRVLGIVNSSDLHMSSHIYQVTSSWASSLYANRVFRSHGLPTTQLHEVARATILLLH